MFRLNKWVEIIPREKCPNKSWKNSAERNCLSGSMRMYASFSRDISRHFLFHCRLLSYSCGYFLSRCSRRPARPPPPAVGAGTGVCAALLAVSFLLQFLRYRTLCLTERGKQTLKQVFLFCTTFRMVRHTFLTSYGDFWDLTTHLFTAMQISV